MSESQLLKRASDDATLGEAHANEGEVAMKKLVGATVLAMASATTFAQNVEIKSIRIGMTKAEFNKHYPKGVRALTIAGIQSKDVAPTVKFVDGVLDTFLFVFPSEHYETVRDAIKAKYPELPCRRSTIKTRVGAEFAQEECGHETFVVSRYVDDIDTSVVAMVSKRALNQETKDRQKKAGDI